MRNAALSSCRAHLIGAAGAGMTALADVLREAGWKLTGSDAAVPPGHSPDYVSRCLDLVVHSAAIPPDNPELQRAAELSVPSLSYGEMLGRLMSGKRGLAVAGTHGKSTTTAMAAAILVRAGNDPTVIGGGVPLGESSGGRFGRGELVLVEACEYRDNFQHLRPQHVALLGIEPDHFDCYESLESLERAMAEFASRVPTDGRLVLRHDCASTAAGGGGAGLPQGDLRHCPRRRLVHRESDRVGRGRLLLLRTLPRRAIAGAGCIAGPRPAQCPQRPGCRRPDRRHRDRPSRHPRRS